MMKFTAAGDMIIQKRMYEAYEGYSELTPFIMKGDARFFNLETTLNHEGEAIASQFSGGTYIRTNPEVLEDIKKLGFNMTSFNNNHALDFSYQGLECTLYAVNKSGDDTQGIPEAKFRTILGHAIVSTDYAGNLVVLKTYAGMAQASAAAIDSMSIENILGTVAGDDTILIVMRTEAEAADFVRKIDKLTK